MTGPPSPKRQRTGEKSDAAAPAIDAEKLQKVLESVAKVDEEIEAENEKMAREVLKIESKYNTAKRPFFEKRAKLLRDIPGFWKQAMSNHPFVAEYISETDEKILESLVDLDVKFLDESGGYKMELTFGENEYFADKMLWKQITYKEEEEIEVKAGEVKWKSTPEAEEAKKESRFIEWLASTEGDQDVAENLKDDVWKNPVMLYMEDDSDEEGEGEGEGDDDDEDEDGDEDETAEDEE